ncbi:MAG TPA: hypothetical protein VFZ36_05600 [Vicinamibacterales bacterium]
MTRSAAILISVLLLAPAAVAPAGAQHTRVLPADMAYLEFTSAARVPGATLDPGFYVFVPSHPVAGQMVIDIYRGGGMALVASFLAVETSLREPGDRPFLDYAGTSPPYLRAWFHRGFRYGYEFVYHPEEAAGIFAASGTSVPATIFRGSTSLVGLLPIDHVGDGYRAGSPRGAAGRFAVEGVVPGPGDQLTLARAEILAHLYEMPPDIATRLRLLNSQIAALMTAWLYEPGEVRRRLALVTATLANTSFPEFRALTHVLERVRERMVQFAGSLR